MSRQQALVGCAWEPVNVITSTGPSASKLAVNRQYVVYIDKRILSLRACSGIIASDQKRYRPGCFARYKIVDPLALFQGSWLDSGMPISGLKNGLELRNTAGSW